VEADLPLSALGIDSLQAVEIRNHLEESLGVDLPAASLLDGPTLDALAAEVLARFDAPPPQATPPVPPGAPAEVDGASHPLSYGQRALWALHQREPESPVYNLALAVRLPGALDRPALRRALQALVDRHPALRTTFDAPTRSAPEAHVAAQQEVSLVEEDARNETAAAFAERLSAFAHRPFDLARGPLLRLALYRTATACVLLLTVHHIVSDLGSLGIVLAELGALYTAYRRNTKPGEPAEPALPTPRLAYDYARRQEEILAGPEGQRLWEYWRHRLAGELPLLDLPLDRPRPTTQTYSGAARAARLEAALGDDLRALCRREGATLFTLLLAAFETLLHRYTGQRSVVVGAPTAGRDRAELADVVGYFVNPVVLLGDLAGDPPFAAFLAQTRTVVHGALAHQDFPFALLVERLQPERDPSRSPLFQVVLTLQKTLRIDSAAAAALALGEAGRPIALGDLTVEPEPLARPVVPFDLTLSLAEAGGPLLASFQYNRDLFDATTLARLAGHFANLLAGVAHEPHLALSALPLLGPAERHQLVVEPAAEMPAIPAITEATGLYKTFAAQVERTPDALAASRAGEHLTYGELDRRACRLAHHLRRLGVGPEVLVGVCLPPSLDLVLALLAVLAAGGAYLPLDPEYPAERLRFMAEDARAPVIVTQEPFRGRFTGEDLALVRLDADAGEIARSAAARPLPDAGGALAGSAAYVIYTSGSTGRPKGVVVSHREVLRLFAATAPWFRFTAGDVWTLFHSYAFDFSVWELWGALLHGGRLVVVPRWLARAPDAFQALLAREGVTVLNQTPSAFYALIEADRAADAGAAESLRAVVFGGEALDPERLAPWFARHGERTKLVNMYGITETTVHVTYRPLGALDLGRPGGSPIGVPIPDLDTHVVDASLQPAPLGVPGELAVGGAGLARGYLGRPELTAVRFCPDPWSGRPGARLYRSGDLVRRRAGGELQYLGRIDQQVKVRGFRVELGEIEAALCRHPAVRAAVVTARADADSVGDRLVAYLVADDDRAPMPPLPPIEELRSFLQETLPDYMVPAIFVPLAALPLSPSGKVDRRALPAPEPVRPELAHARIAPRNETEAELAAIWSEVLRVPEVGVTDNFFALGGDSILSLQVVARAHQRGYRLTPRQAFEHQTIAELAAAAATNEAETLKPAMGTAGDLETAEGAYPLTPLQQGLLFHSVYEPDLDEYLVQVLCKLAGPLDFAALAAAWSLAVSRHPALRTAFRWQEGGAAVQEVEAAAEPAWRREDWRPLDPVRQESRLADLLAEDRRQGFDLRVAPLLRLALLRLADERHQLLLSFHHLILDGWSTAALLKEVLTAYAALHAGHAPELPPAPPFRDYLVWLAAQDPGQAETYWRRRLQGFAAPTPLAADRPPGAVPPRYGERRLALPSYGNSGLGAFARRHRLTQGTLVQAAWGLLLACHAGERDVVFGTTVAGRPAELPGVESMLGLLINTLPVRLATDPAEPLLPWLAALQADLVEMRQFEHSALAAVQGWSEVPRGQALFDSIVIFENYPLDRSLLGRRGELDVSDVRSVEWTHYPLSLTALPGDTLELQVVYDQRRFDAATADRLLAHLERLLAGMAASGEAAGRRLADLSPLTPAEEQQICHEWNDSRAPRAADLCLHQRFAANAAEHGDRTAVVEPGTVRHFSYRELDRRANHLAHRLSALGVGPEVLVGICLERRLEMVAVHLAVLKAGGGYLPLDPTYPAARLAFMLEDARIAALVTEPHLLAALPDHPAPRVLLAAEAPRLPGLSDAPPESGVRPENVSHVLYTSGSTGTPKAVVLPHCTVARFTDSVIRTYDLRPGDRVLQFGSISFDAATEELYTCLTVGGTLVLRGDTMLASTSTFLEECAAFGITILDLPTAFWHQLAAGLAAGLAAPGGLRSVVIAGERAAPERLADWLRHAAPGTLLTNAYGPTEGTIVAAAFAPRPGAAARREVPIGRPIGNARVHLLDPDLRPVPIGPVGELLIGGDGVTRGYLRRPALTAEKFIPDPWGEPGARLYRTGDLARHLADGTLELAGRIDHQVKLRGFRVELGEVESALLKHPSIEQAAVHPWTDDQGGKRLVAYVVAEPGAPPPTAPELRRFLAEQLPPYMVPSLFELLPALPLTASGSKVDRRSLPPPQDVRPELETPYQPPSSPVEVCLAEIWSRVLGLSRVGRDDNFFALGGDSILSLQATARAHQAGLRFTPKQLFEHQTIGELAGVVEITRAAAPAPPEPVTGELPLTPIQEWFFALDLPRPAHWNQAVLLTVAPGDGVPGGDPRAWHQAIATLLAHHDALRFAFPPPEGGRRRARAAALAEVPFTYCDLRSLPALLQGPTTTAAAAAAQASLSLGGPLLRAIYFDWGAGRPARLLLAIHHLVVDGVSWRLLVEDLATVCHQLRQGAAPRLPAKTSSFKQWAERLVLYARSPAVEPEIGHWLAIAAMAATEQVALPLDFVPGPPPLNTEADLASVRRALAPDETRALLTEVPPAYGTEINDTLLAALLRALTPWTGSPALAIELEGHGREPLFDDVDVSRTVGWFTTAFPVRLVRPPADDPGATLKAVKEQLRAVPGRGIGYGLLRFLRGDAALAGELRRLSRPEIGFNYLGQLDQVLGGASPVALAPESPGPTRDPLGARPHLLEVEGRVSAGRLEIEWLYSRRLHRENTIARLADAYLAELRATIAHCRAREARGYTPSDFPQMSFDQDELDALLDDLAGSLEGAG
ncbi:MAG TPA: amino acid adenylation domain-containing protein, partial [Thermoanaerobaculia bacterium]|nr:amino acid adenylation domain-containing protein [Thermoanaerobaculia bacterium]